MYSYDKYNECVDVILGNGLFRKFKDGSCIFKLNDGTIDKLEITNDMTVRRYRDSFREFCLKYEVDSKKVTELFYSNRE